MSLTVYKASAGSGKTFTLTVEYIRRLVEEPAAVYSYPETLAVTFTNKATTEMKDRIVETLYAIAHSQPEGEGYLKAIMKSLKGEEVKTIRERCRQALGAILHDYSHFRVETIDTFFQSVLRDLAHELGLAAGLQTDLDTKTAIGDAVERLFDRLDTDDMLRHRISAFVRQRIDDAQGWNVMKRVKSYANHIFDSDYQAVASILAARLGDSEFVRAFTNKLDEIIAEGTDIAFNCAEQMEYKLEELGVEATDFSNGGDITSHLAKVRRGELGDFGKRLLAAIDNPLKLVTKAKQKDEALVEAARQISDLLGEMRQVEEAVARKLSTARLIKQQLSELCLLKAVESEVHRLTAERGTFLLAHTPQLLSRMVKGGDTPFIYEKMGTRLRNVMIDEFQDTSRLQWHNFSTLLRDNMDRGGSTLVVGDVKQSIYRWRDGDWRILHGLHHELSRYNPEVIPLETNWRSLENVVKFNNRLYTTSAEAMGLADVYKGAEQEFTEHDAKGFVRLHCFDKTLSDDDRRALTMKDMCSEIARLHQEQEVPWSQMAILIRYNDDEEAIAAAFDTYLPNVPLVSSGVFSLGSSRAVRFIIDALRCLFRPDDRPAQACLMHNCEAVTSQRRERNGNTQCLVHNEDVETLHLESAEVESFLADRERLLRQPLYELVMHIVATFRLDTMSGQEAYLLTFYDQLATWLNRHSGNIGSFIEDYDSHISKATVGGCEVDGINVLSIHKSKGLEWHSVFIPFADWEMEDSRETAWCSTHDVEPFCALPLVPVRKGKLMAASIFAPEHEQLKLQQQTDNLNLLYVATTRAGSNLYVWGEAQKQNAMGVIRQYIADGWEKEDDGMELWQNGTRASYVESEKKQNRMHPQYKSMDVNLRPYPSLATFVQSGEADRFLSVKDEGLSVKDEVKPHTSYLTLQPSYIDQGLLLHAVFEQIETAGDAQRVIETFVQRGLIADNEMRQRIERLVGAGLANPKVASWFDGTGQVLRECTILTSDGEYRPDRVIVRPDHITVVDYKFGQPKEEHHTQVEEYMRLIQTMYPQSMVEGFLWYVYQNKVESV